VIDLSCWRAEGIDDRGAQPQAMAPTVIVDLRRMNCQIWFALGETGAARTRRGLQGITTTNVPNATGECANTTKAAEHQRPDREVKVAPTGCEARAESDDRHEGDNAELVSCSEDALIGPSSLRLPWMPENSSGVSMRGCREDFRVNKREHRVQLRSITAKTPARSGWCRG
jgi:hypothetical protein